MKNLTSIAEHSDWLAENIMGRILKWELHRKRVEFGKQPLALWMLVPSKLVDGVWEVLEEPLQKDVKYDCLNFKGEEDFDVKKWTADFVEYDEAKERCLFEGFQYEKESKMIISDDFGLDSEDLYLMKIEDIIQYKPLLTATAQKIIGL